MPFWQKGKITTVDYLPFSPAHWTQKRVSGTSECREGWKALKCGAGADLWRDARQRTIKGNRVEVKGNRVEAAEPGGKDPRLWRPSLP